MGTRRREGGGGVRGSGGRERAIERETERDRGKGGGGRWGGGVGRPSLTAKKGGDRQTDRQTDRYRERNRELRESYKRESYVSYERVTRELRESYERDIRQQGRHCVHFACFHELCVSVIMIDE